MILISCPKCEFKISQKMRFSLVKNFCPSCGGSLLSDLEAQNISNITKKIQSQDFIISLSNQLSKELVQNLIYDLGIFFKFELEKTYQRDNPDFIEVKPSLDQEPEQDTVSLAEASPKEKRPLRQITRGGEGLRDLQRMSRHQTRELEERESEYEEDDNEDFEDDESDEVGNSSNSIAQKVQRLKQVYNTSPTLKKISAISRIDED